MLPIKIMVTDAEGNLIDVTGPTGPPVTSATSVGAATWTKISVPAGVSGCYEVYMRSRSGDPWKFSSSADGSGYMTQDDKWAFSCNLAAGATIGYVQASGADYLELACVQ